MNVSSSRLSALFRGSDAADETRLFVQRLNQFKSQGCCILVTGKADSDIFNRQLRKSLGDPTCKQVLVTTDTDPTHILGPNISPSEPSVATLKQSTRSTSSSDTPTGQLDKLSSDVLDIVHRFDDEFDLTDNNLRIGIEALNQMGDRTDHQAVLRFIRSLSQTVEFVSGTVYCQFRDAPERAAYLVESGLFDARIELRNDEQGEERWHLPEDNITTDWVEL